MQIRNVYKLKNMKKTLILFIGIVTISYCYSQENLVKSNNDFAFKIYKATRPDSDNFFISPFSLNIALSVANEGAKSATRQEMDSLLSMRNIENRALQYSSLIRTTTDLNDSDFRKCNEWTEDTTNKNSLFLANSLWINDAFQIDKNFIKNIEENYNSEIFSFNKFNVATANNELNAWVSGKTNNKINNITGLDKDIMMSIVNAIYFMGEWNNPFDTTKTKEKKFHTIQREKVDINYMCDQFNYLYYEDNDIQSIFLPYKCNQFSMMVILPQERYGILEIEKKLSPDYIMKIKNSSSSSEVKLSLPKFRIESEILPKEEIINMGYPLMFSNKADFTKMSQTDSLKISRIIHKTFIEIDEKKTEAAAVTKVDMVVIGYGTGGDPTPPPAPKIFNADHPFIFMIIDNRTDAILFTGRFVTE
jgi:serpin B